MFEKNNILEARIKYTADLKTIIPRVFYEDSPPDGTTYPFVVFEFVDTNADGASTEIFDLYIDGWDDDSDTTVLETLMFNINNLIDKKTYEVSESTLSFRAELDKKQNIKDAEVSLKHKQYRYSLKTIQRRT
jgi:hypothetical protein